jgi:hypothetical protein
MSISTRVLKRLDLVLKVETSREVLRPSWTEKQLVCCLLEYKLGDLYISGNSDEFSYF